MSKPIQTIQFDTPLVTVKDWTIARIPEDESVKLTSRGQISVKGTIDGHDFQTVLEPDGYWSHWFRVDDATQKRLGVKPGDVITVELTPVKEWPEPTLPSDIKKALDTAPKKCSKNGATLHQRHGGNGCVGSTRRASKQLVQFGLKRLYQN